MKVRIALKTLTLLALLTASMLLHASTILSTADSNLLVTTFNGSLTVGTATPNSGNCIPFNCNVAGQIANVDYQQVYTSAAFAGPTTLSSLTLYNWGLGGNSLVIGGTYSVYLSTTSAAVDGLNGTNLALNRGPDWTVFGSFLAGTDTNPSITINGIPFSYNPANGNLLLEIFGLGQANICNGCGNSYMAVDTSGSVGSRALAYTTAIPEPGTLVMFGSGIIGLAGLLRRKINL